LIAEMAAAAKVAGKTLVDVMEEIYEEFGIHKERLVNLNFPDSKAGMDQMVKLMERFRKTPPHKIDGKKVIVLEDFLKGVNSLPSSDVLLFKLEDQSKLVIRPSGTEPKVKIYAEVV